MAKPLYENRVGGHPTLHTIDADWKQHAACIGEDPELFFPLPGGHNRVIIAEAKRICNACPVWKTCLQAGMFEKFGIWGGQTKYERSPRIQEAKRRQNRERKKARTDAQSDAPHAGKDRGMSNDPVPLIDALAKDFEKKYEMKSTCLNSKCSLKRFHEGPCKPWPKMEF